MQYLVGIITLLLGVIGFFWSRSSSLSGLLDNLKTKQDLLGLDKSIDKNDVQLDTEEQKRTELAKPSTPSSSTDDLLNFLNKDVKK